MCHAAPTIAFTRVSSVRELLWDEGPSTPQLLLLLLLL
jgi:hypothetical protein